MVPGVDVYECRGSSSSWPRCPGCARSLRVIPATGARHHGERRERRPAGIGGFLCMERPQAASRARSCSTSPVDIQQAEAHLAGGLLTVTLPRLKDRRGRETVIPVAARGARSER